MTTKNTFAPKSVLPAYFIKPMLLGAGIALVLIIVFLSKVQTSPTWPKFWMARPLIIVPLAGAAGGAVWALLRPMRQKGGWAKAGAIVLGLIIFIIGLWMGTVLGLDGTLWD